MKRNLIHLSFSPLSPMLAQNLCLKEMQEAGYEVKYFDLNGIFNQKVKHDPTFAEFVQFINSWEELDQKLKNFDSNSTLLNIQIGPDKSNFSILKRLYSLPFKTTFFEVGTLPENTVRTYIRKIKYRIADFPMTPDYIFRAGKFSSLPFSKKCKVLPINYCDYDSSLKSGDDLPAELKGKNYCVFIDQFIPGHPDFINNDIDQLKYYQSISSFLLKIEKKYGFIPVIALHPKADSNVFENSGILTFKHKTIHLIKNSSLVVAHYSTAISFAAIYNKPVLFIINDEMLKCALTKMFRKQIRNHANFFGAKVINCDHYSFHELSIVPHAKKYENFLFDFLTHRETKSTTNETLLKAYYQRIFSEIR